MTQNKTITQDGFEILQLLTDSDRLLAIRIYKNKENKNEFVSYYLNGNLWIKEEWDETPRHIYDIGCVEPNIQKIIRSFDINNYIRKNGELK